MAKDDQRISGWKAIGAHFGRDRTTAIRWANERGLPVHRVPGAKAATVFAIKTELDAWLTGQGQSSPGIAQNGGSVSRSKALRGHFVALIAALLLAVAALAWLLHPGPAGALPRDREAAKLYVEARDSWAQRTAPSLAGSITKLQAVIARDPDFAPAHAALAEAYLLSHEFGSLPVAVAYPRAKQSAERALTLDGGLAGAHRALGFVIYWWERDPKRAGREFRLALALDPAAAQTRFWYANILVDNGEQTAAMREFDAARLGDPGSVPIRTDWAWALWSGGDTAKAIAELEAIVAQNPSVATAHDCLAEIALGEGDYAGYVRHLAAREALRTEPELRGHVSALKRALAAGDKMQLQALIFQRAIDEETASPFPNHAYAAFVASAAGNRAGLLRVLRLANEQGQRWGSAGYVRRIAARWRDDSEIIRLLQARRGARIEASS